MPYVIRYTDPAVAEEDVDAEEMAREGVWLVFRRTVMVIARPRTIVVLRAPAEAVSRVEQQGS